MINYDQHGVQTPGKPSHDYTEDLISVTKNGPKEYLQAKHALQLCREIWPNAKITSTLLHYHRALRDPDTNKLAGGLAVVHVRVELPDGTIGDAHGSETIEDFPEFLEKAETKALKRALTAAGIGVQFDVSEFDYEEKNPREFKGAIGDAPPRVATAQDKPPTPIRTPASEEETIDQITGEITTPHTFVRPARTPEEDAVLLLDTAVKTGHKAQVIKAWTSICRSSAPSQRLTDHYQQSLTKVT